MIRSASSGVGGEYFSEVGGEYFSEIGREYFSETGGEYFSETGGENFSDVCGDIGGDEEDFSSGGTACGGTAGATSSVGWKSGTNFAL